MGGIVNKIKKKDLKKDFKEYVPRSPKEVKEPVKKLSRKTNGTATSADNLRNLERR